MNKESMIKQLAIVSGISQEKCRKVLDAFMEVVLDAMASHERVNLVGFGSFNAKKVPGREVYDINTGGKEMVPEHFRPVFMPGKAMKEAVNT